MVFRTVSPSSSSGPSACPAASPADRHSGLPDCIPSGHRRTKVRLLGNKYRSGVRDTYLAATKARSRAPLVNRRWILTSKPYLVPFSVGWRAPRESQVGIASGNLPKKDDRPTPHTCYSSGTSNDSRCIPWSDKPRSRLTFRCIPWSDKPLSTCKQGLEPLSTCKQGV